MIYDSELREVVNQADGPEGRVRLVRERGFDFTVDELEDVVAELADVETVDDLQAHDEAAGFAFADLLGIENQLIVTVYDSGIAPSRWFFQEPGPVPFIQLMPLQSP
jgi:hypothetical protein